MQNVNAVLLNEAKHHLDRLAELAVALHAQGLAGAASAHLSAETPADRENGIALLGRTAQDLLNQQDYDRLVTRLGHAPALDTQAFINYDLRTAFSAALLTLLTL